MKTGLNIVDMAKEIQRQQEVKKDLVIDTQNLDVEQVGDTEQFNLVATMASGEQERFGLQDNAHNQIATRLKIPTRYYDRMRKEAPQLLVDSTKHWFNDNPEKRMVRTLDGKARAFLSNSYKRIDNMQIASAVLPELMGKDEIEIISSDITSSKMYIQARFPRMEGEVRVGDVVQGGLIITNSEIGKGSLDIRPMMYRLICTNGMVTGNTMENGRLKRRHLGARIESDNDDFTIYSDETLQADDHALMLKIRDSIKALSDPALFAKLMEEMRQAANSDKIKNPIAATEVMAKSFALPESERHSFLENLIRDQDYTKWGVLNAVTQIANSHDSYDRAIELEELGGKVLNMPEREWNTLINAA